MYKNYNFARILISTFTFILCFFMCANSIYAQNYIYNLQSNLNANTQTDESSISTIATPDFSFQSASQILIEPTTGKILYANNENEKLLPASVTKIMTY